MGQKWMQTAGSVAVLVVLTAIGAQFSPAPASAQPGSAPVTIVGPLPVPVTGTVTVGNLGSNTLPVSVTNFPATQPVSVASTSGTPVWVRQVDAPGSHPVSGSVTPQAPEFAVPATVDGRPVRALVVTQVGGFCTGIGSFNLGLLDVVGGSAVATFHFRVDTLLPSIPGGNNFPILTQQTQIYLGAGHALGLGNTTPGNGCHFDFSGYYVTQ